MINKYTLGGSNVEFIPIDFPVDRTEFIINIFDKVKNDFIKPSMSFFDFVHPETKLTSTYLIIDFGFLYIEHKFLFFKYRKKERIVPEKDSIILFIERVK